MNTNKDRLIKLLKMLNSDYDGEVLNAAHSIKRLMNESNQTWEELLDSTNTVKKNEYKYQPEKPMSKATEGFDQNGIAYKDMWSFVLENSQDLDEKSFWKSKELEVKLDVLSLVDRKKLRNCYKNLVMAPA